MSPSRLGLELAHEGLVLADGVLGIEARNVGRGLARVVLRAGRRAGGEQDVDAVELPVARCVVQRRVLLAVDARQVGVGFDERARDLRMPALRTSVDPAGRQPSRKKIFFPKTGKVARGGRGGKRLCMSFAAPHTTVAGTGAWLAYE